MPTKENQTTSTFSILEGLENLTPKIRRLTSKSVHHMTLSRENSIKARVYASQWFLSLGCRLAWVIWGGRPSGTDPEAEASAGENLSEGGNCARVPRSCHCSLCPAQPCSHSPLISQCQHKPQLFPQKVMMCHCLCYRHFFYFDIKQGFIVDKECLKSRSADGIKMTYLGSFFPTAFLLFMGIRGCGILSDTYTTSGLH